MPTVVERQSGGGEHQSVFAVDVASRERDVFAFVTFLLESGGLRPNVKADAPLTQDEKDAVRAWVGARWPARGFHEPIDWQHRILAG